MEEKCRTFKDPIAWVPSGGWGYVYTGYPPLASSQKRAYNCVNYITLLNGYTFYYSIKVLIVIIIIFLNII